MYLFLYEKDSDNMNISNRYLNFDEQWAQGSQERYESHKSPGIFIENLANCFRRFSGDAHKMLTKFCEHFVSIL